MNYVRIEEVTKRYGAVTAIDRVRLTAPIGTRTAVVGPSGSGKTTLLRLIAGFDVPDVGRIVIDDRVVAGDASWVPAHRRGVGYVSQHGALFPHLSVARNIGFGLPRGTPDRGKRIDALLESVELDGEMGIRRPDELSGGQQQRVALARALARQPKLMLLDEPFSALDTALRESTRKMVARVLGAAGVTTILVTHDQAEALSFADQVAVLDGGRLMQAGTPRELYLRPRDEVTAAFLGEAITLPAELGDGYADCALGRIPTETGARSGRATIMLRPEQVRVIPFGEGYARAARVMDIEFGGASSLVILAVEGLTDPLRIRMTSAELPLAGGAVEIAILGRAHVLPLPSD